MNIRERIERLEALETEFNEKIKALKAEVQREDEFPQYGDTHWYINTYGAVSEDIWEEHVAEKNMIKIGNVFRTEQEAQFAVEKLKVEAELRKFSRPIDYEDRNWAILWNIDEKSIETRYNYGMVRQGTIYFESKEKAQQAIESVGEDRIKKYLFGVE